MATTAAELADPQAIRATLEQHHPPTAEQFLADYERALAVAENELRVDDLQHTLDLWQRAADRMAQPDPPAGALTADQVRGRLGV